MALRLLDDLADDQVLSLRAVAREAGIAATSVYIHFADRDALVLAALEHCHTDLLNELSQAEQAAADPVAALRARTILLGVWAGEHPGLYKVLHESTLNQRADMSFKNRMATQMIAAIRRCMDAGLAPRGDAETVAPGPAHGRPRRVLAARQPAGAALASAGGAGGPVPDEAGRCPGRGGRRADLRLEVWRSSGERSEYGV